MNLRFTVEMGELRKKVNFVRNGLGTTKADLPTMLMRFDVQDRKAILFAANKEMWCRTEMKIKRDPDTETGSFSVLGDRVEKLISQVEAEQVSFQTDGENLEVQAGFLTVNFETYDGSTLKTIEQGAEGHLKEEGLAVAKDPFQEGFACARACTTTNSIRPDVTHVELRGGRVLSSDGRKIMIYSFDGFPEDMAIKVPSTVLNATLTAIKNMEAPAVQVFEMGSHYVVKGNKNEFTLGVRRVERDFPAVEGQITRAEDPTDEIVVDKNVLEAMLKGVSLGLPSNEVKVTVDVGGEGAEAYLEVSAINSVNRRSHERASCGRKTKGHYTFPLSFKHLLDTLGVFKGDSVVDLMVMEPRKMLMVRDTTEEREVLTVIPFRTDADIEAEKAEEAAKKATKEEEKKEDEELAGAAVEDEFQTDIDLDD